MVSTPGPFRLKWKRWIFNTRPFPIRTRRTFAYTVRQVQHYVPITWEHFKNAENLDSRRLANTLLLANTTIIGGAPPRLRSGNENRPGITGGTKNSELKLRHSLRVVYRSERRVWIASEKGAKQKFLDKTIANRIELNMYFNGKSDTNQIQQLIVNIRHFYCK